MKRGAEAPVADAMPMVGERPPRGSQLVFALPRSDAVRFRRGAVTILLLVAALAIVLTISAASGLPAIPPVSLYAAVPLLGGIVGLWRLTAAREAGPGRSHAVLAVFSLGLLAWAVSAVIYLIEQARGAPLIEFPSLVDIPNYVSAACWGVGVWLLYEGAVDDFLDEITRNFYFLTMLALGIFFVLSIAHGEDFGELLWSGDALAVHITEGVIPLAYAVNGFLLFRASRGRIGKRLRAGHGALKMLAAGLGLALVAELIFEFGLTMMTNDPRHPLAYRNGGLADSLEVTAYLLLSLGLVAFPLDTLLFVAASGDAASDAEVELDPTLEPEPELERLMG